MPKKGDKKADDSKISDSKGLFGQSTFGLGSVASQHSVKNEKSDETEKTRKSNNLLRKWMMDSDDDEVLIEIDSDGDEKTESLSQIKTNSTP